ncbi:hypothetical protein DMC30DRAFT_11092 [Rhodotorula diobovata]|uniref:Uncharacterized protein n=1 Tax=Rhodotorula diobovata TaxID=5288 RepID=A0A5C5G3Q1_9BASI|nr:hypothetical protein DMC30DRAFT_11092 [Rhodotorula diobovata]
MARRTKRPPAGSSRGRRTRTLSVGRRARGPAAPAAAATRPRRRRGRRGRKSAGTEHSSSSSLSAAGGHGQCGAEREPQTAAAAHRWRVQPAADTRKVGTRPRRTARRQRSAEVQAEQVARGVELSEARAHERKLAALKEWRWRGPRNKRGGTPRGPGGAHTWRPPPPLLLHRVEACLRVLLSSAFSV